MHPTFLKAPLATRRRHGGALRPQRLAWTHAQAQGNDTLVSVLYGKLHTQTAATGQSYVLKISHSTFQSRWHLSHLSFNYRSARQSRRHAKTAQSRSQLYFTRKMQPRYGYWLNWS